MASEDAVFKAIAHPVRREIIGLLAIESRSVKDLTAEFEMSQSAVSQHLKELKDADLVTSERIGVEQHYRLTPEPLQHIMRWSDAYCHLVDPSGHLWTFMPAKNREQSSPKKREKQYGR